MNVGKTIIEIRKKHHMTQEEFARLFYVTRQTVSNWENQKSYPDLQTLVEISNKFDVSLDKMLKEDTGMLKKFNREIKFGKQMKKGLLGILVCLVFASVAWVIVWNVNKNEAEETFQRGVESLGFKYDSQLGYYSKKVSKTQKYVLPNQKMPGILNFSTDFHAKFLDFYEEFEGNPLQLRWSGEDSNGENTFSIFYAEKGQMKALSEKEKAELISEKVQASVITEGESIYQTVYR